MLLEEDASSIDSTLVEGDSEESEEATSIDSASEGGDSEDSESSDG
jgi:hypothetical protein